MTGCWSSSECYDHEYNEDDTHKEGLRDQIFHLSHRVQNIGYFTYMTTKTKYTDIDFYDFLRKRLAPLKIEMSTH